MTASTYMHIHVIFTFFSRKWRLHYCTTTRKRDQMSQTRRRERPDPLDSDPTPCLSHCSPQP